MFLESPRFNTPSFALLQSLAKVTGDAYVVEKIIGQKKRHDGVTMYHVDWGERYGSDLSTVGIAGSQRRTASGHKTRLRST